MKNINKEVWRYIDNNMAIRKNLYDDIINVRALAKKIITDAGLTCSLNAVISAIRRYEGSVEGKDKVTGAYKLLRRAKLSTKTKLVSVLFRKDDQIRRKLGDRGGGDSASVGHRQSRGVSICSFSISPPYSRTAGNESTVPCFRDWFLTDYSTTNTMWLVISLIIPFLSWSTTSWRGCSSPDTQ